MHSVRGVVTRFEFLSVSFHQIVKQIMGMYIGCLHMVKDLATFNYMGNNIFVIEVTNVHLVCNFDILFFFVY